MNYFLIFALVIYYLVTRLTPVALFLKYGYKAFDGDEDALFGGSLMLTMAIVPILGELIYLTIILMSLVRFIFLTAMRKGD